MSDSTSRPRRRTRKTRDPRIDGPELATLLPSERIEAALRAERVNWRHKVFTPVVTVWAFLAQVLSPDRCCRAAVARVWGWRVGPGGPSCPPTGGGFCKARARLGEAVPRRLARDAGRQLHRRARPAWLWRGRPVKVVDGTTLSMPDTPANQAEDPQPTAQAPGLGFPLMRAVVVFGLATGAALDAALARCRGKGTGEPSLLRELVGTFEPGDVVLADRGFGSFYALALWHARGVDAVVRLHQARVADFRTGRRLGTRDHVVTWERPDRPAWVDDERFELLPRKLSVREVGVRVVARGFRTRQLVVVTTLTDPVAYPAEALAELYRARWHAELDRRALKVTLGMDVLRCKRPELVRAEFWMHRLGYHVIRGVLADAAVQARCVPRELSFAGAVQAVVALGLGSPTMGADWRRRLLELIRRHRVGNRPNRVEPRARKRRPKHGALLTTPRERAQARLRRGLRA